MEQNPKYSRLDIVFWSSILVFLGGIVGISIYAGDVRGGLFGFGVWILTIFLILGIFRLITARMRMQRIVGALMAVIPLLSLGYLVRSTGDYSFISGLATLFFLVTFIFGIFRIATAQFWKQRIVGVVMIIIPLLSVAVWLFSTFRLLPPDEFKRQYSTFFLVSVISSLNIIGLVYAISIMAKSKLSALKQVSLVSLFAIIFFGLEGSIWYFLGTKLPSLLVYLVASSLPLLFFLFIDIFRWLRGKELLVKQNKVLVTAHIVTIFFMIAIPSLTPSLAVVGNAYDKFRASKKPECDSYKFWECPENRCAVIKNTASKPVLCRKKNEVRKYAKIEAEKYREIPQQIIDLTNRFAMEQVGKEFFDANVTLNIYDSTYKDQSSVVEEERKYLSYEPPYGNIVYEYYFPEISAGAAFSITMDPKGTLLRHDAPRCVDYPRACPPAITKEKAIEIALQNGFDKNHVQLDLAGWNNYLIGFQWKIHENIGGTWANPWYTSKSMTIDATTGAASDFKEYSRNVDF